MTTDARRKDEAIIRDLIARWASAIETKDAEKVVEAYAPDAVLYDVAFPVHGKEAIKALWERCFPFFPDAFRSEHEDLSVTVEGDIAIAHGLHRFIPDEPDHPCSQFISRVTAVFRRMGGEWRVIHEHVSIPFQMEGADACVSVEAKQKSAAELAADNGVHRLSPHLVCAKAAEAIEFYRKAFGATELMRLPGPDGKLMHACVRINGSSVMLVDEYANMGIKSPTTLGGTPVTMHLIVEDADASAERAVAAGATLVMPVADMFWGDRYGVLGDPFGHRWAVATSKRPVFGKELEDAAAAAIAAHRSRGGGETCA